MDDALERVRARNCGCPCYASVAAGKAVPVGHPDEETKAPGRPLMSGSSNHLNKIEFDGGDMKKAKTSAKKAKKRDEAATKVDAPPTKDASQGMSGKDYDRELKKLHAELVKLQQWVVHKGLKVCIVFEGRDGAGKGGTIKALTERVSPRVFRVVAL